MKKCLFGCALLLAAANLFAGISMTGSYRLEGDGSWTTYDSVYIGDPYGVGSGPGVVLIDGGTQATAGAILVGDSKYGWEQGSFTVSGTNTFLRMSGIFVGTTGTGRVDVVDGAEVDGGKTTLGCDGLSGAHGGGSATLTVSGTGTVYKSNEMWIGSDDYWTGNQARLNIHKGSRVLVPSNLFQVDKTGFVSIEVSTNNMLVVGPSIYNAGIQMSGGTIELYAAEDLAAGTYTPISGDWSTWQVSGTVSAKGGIWDSNNHTFTVSDPAETNVGNEVVFELADVQRVSFGSSVSMALTPGTGTIRLKAETTPEEDLGFLQPMLDPGETILDSYDFIAEGLQGETLLSYEIGPGFSDESLHVWHYDGNDWTNYVPGGATYVGDMFTFAVDSFSSYAVTTSDPVIESYDLLEYRGPLDAGTTWFYSGRDWDGLVSDTLMKVAPDSREIVCYTDGASATAYTQTVGVLNYSSGSMNPDDAFAVTDAWDEFATVDPTFRLWGSDDDAESIRVDGGIDYGTSLSVGQTNSVSAPAYVDGAYIGMLDATIGLLGVEAVSVPAGIFSDCLHLRFAINPGGEWQSWDEWWNADAGVVKMEGVSGDGSGRLRELEWVHTPVIGMFSNFTSFAHDNVIEGVTNLYSQQLDAQVEALTGSVYRVTAVADGGSLEVDLTQTGEMDGSLLRTLAPVDFDGWNLLDMGWLSDGNNIVFAFRGQEDSNTNDISITGAAFSETASSLADDFTGKWVFEGYSHDNLVNPDEEFYEDSLELTFTKTDDTHIETVVEGVLIPLVITNQMAVLESGPVTMPDARLVSVQVSTDGLGMSLYLVFTDLENYAAAGTLIALGTPFDADGDGLPDSWETEYFGLPSYLSPESLCSNGINTVWDAYIAGLDPTDPNDRFLVGGTMAGDLGVLSWPAVSGRVYDVWFSTNLLSGFDLIYSNLPWTQNSVTGAVSEVDNAYYKIDVRLDD
jgi:hypothetical protein